LEPSAQTAEPPKSHFLPLLLLLLLTAVTYHGVFSHEFLVNWDDPGYITGNRAIMGVSAAHLKSAFTSQFVGNYSPVQIVSYMLDYSLWGLNAGGFLLSNVIVHYLNGVLLYLLLIRLGAGKWGAVFGGALFLVHPVQMESVAWVSQRKNLLALLFSLLGFHAFLSHRQVVNKAGLKWYLASFALFVLALLSKPVAVVFPLMLILYDRMMFAGQRPPGSYLDKVPYLIAAAVVGLVTVSLQIPGVVGGRIEYPAAPWLVLPLTMLPVLVSYLRLLVWPMPSTLSIIYTTPLKHGLDSDVVLGLCVAVVLAALAVYLYRKDRSACFWYVLFFVGFLPVSQVIPLVTMMNDRYLYFPMVGGAGLAGYLAGCGWERLRRPLPRALGISAAVVVVALLSVACHVRGRVWQNSITLFSDAVLKAPRQLNPLLGLAEAYQAAGDYNMAIRYYEEASTYGYLNSEVSCRLARIYLDRGEPEKAFSHIWSFLLKSGNSKEGLLLLGEYYGMTGAYRDAEQKLLMYLETSPDSMPGLMLLGKVYLKSHDYEHARNYLMKAVGAGGDSAELSFDLACLESAAGRVDRSLGHMRRAVRQGFSVFELMETYGCFDAMRQDRRFRLLLEEHASEVSR
jgi:tetratricopeptide (TPR) repeat protein